MSALPLLSARRAWLWCAGLLWLAGCTDAYLPDVVKTPPSYLVVDGLINPVGVTTVRLSRSYAIAAAKTPPAETKATVYVEEENGPQFALRENTGGTYASTALSLNPAKRYRLHIRTQPGKEYASAYVPVELTPAIDQVKWRAESTGLNIYVDTHDPANNTHYYRWDYAETWEITPIYNPFVEYVNRAIGMRDLVTPLPRLCWGNDNSTTVQMEQTTALSQDVVSNHRLRQVGTTSERLHTRYSILVQQHAMTREEYAYWDLLRKNTESIGTLFDPQPVQLTGNVKCLSDPTDLALGYIGAHTIAEQRIFIRNEELPRSWLIRSGYELCVPPDTVYFHPRSNHADELAAAFSPGTGLVPIEPLYEAGTGAIRGYTAKDRDCVDCRTRGTSVRPSFW